VKKRLLYGAAMTAGLITFLALDYAFDLHLLFIAIAVAAAALGMSELFAIMQQCGLRPLFRTAFLLTCVMLGWEVAQGRDVGPTLAVGLSAIPLTLGLAIVVVGLVALWIGRGRARLADVAATVFGLVYIGVPIAILASLRNLGPTGKTALLALIFATKGGDVAAFFVGSLVGKTRIAPTVSGGKTVEGTAAGVAAAALIGWGVFALLGADLPAWIALAFGASMGVAGFFGDLFESNLKREAGIKDSARLVPEFGGTLDMLDSLLFAAPVALLFVLAMT